MVKVKHNSKKKKVFITGITLLILILGFSIADRILENLVRLELNKQLNLNDSSLYTIEYDEVKINILSGSLKIKNLIIAPQKMAMEQLKKGQIKELVRTEVPLYQIKNLDLMALYHSNDILINKVESDKVLMDYYFNPKTSQTTIQNTLAIQEIVSDNFHKAHISTLSLRNTRLRFIQTTSIDSTIIFQMDSLNMLAINLRINSETLQSRIPFSLDDLRMNARNFQFKALDDYTISDKLIDFNFKDSSISIEGFKLKPKYNRAGFLKKLNYNTDILDIEIPQLVFGGINIHELENNIAFDIATLNIQQAIIKIYRDKRLPDAPFKYKPLLAGMVKNIPFSIRCDSLIFSNCTLSYEEQISKMDSPGKIWIDPMNLVATNITNIPGRIALNPLMTIDFNGKIMSKAQLNIKLSTHLDTPHEKFKVNGTLAATPIKLFNPMVENLTPVNISKGRLLNASFQFLADNSSSEGILQMEYEGLIVNVSRSKNHQRKWAILSLIANGFIRPENLKTGKKYLTGRIHFDRRQDKSIINFLWNSIKTGAIAIVAPIADQNKKERKKQKRRNRKKASNKE